MNCRTWNGVPWGRRNNREELGMHDLHHNQERLDSAIPQKETFEPCPQSMGKMDFPMEVSVVVFEMA